MKRRVEPEQLDALAPDTSEARRARRDLAWINLLMGNVRRAAEALQSCWPSRPLRMADLGAGDGSFIAGVAKRLPKYWQKTEVLLVDRHPSVRASAISQLQRLGWTTRQVTADVPSWLGTPFPERLDLVLANLFLHHFSDRDLAALLGLILRATDGLIAIDPSRTRLSLLCSRLLWLIGCGPVTRRDAPISVCAGFQGRELTGLWPTAEGWALTEGSAGIFGHLFIARRLGEGGS